MNFFLLLKRQKKKNVVRDGKKIKVSGGCSTRSTKWNLRKEWLPHSVGIRFCRHEFLLLYSFFSLLISFLLLFSRDGSVLLKCGLVLFNGVIFLTPFLDSILEAKVSWWDILPRKKKKRDGYKRRKFFSYLLARKFFRAVRLTRVHFFF